MSLCPTVDINMILYNTTTHLLNMDIVYYVLSVISASLSYNLNCDIDIDIDMDIYIHIVYTRIISHTSWASGLFLWRRASHRSHTECAGAPGWICSSDPGGVADRIGKWGD